ncbi:hypothetical protein DFJ74DRAFT_766118 [Hyaloraphidium curvatum]|nr:hypothetical protein DFJ74DRAFT_766118 [Hyaloraphidium curvatum]
MRAALPVLVALLLAPAVSAVTWVAWSPSAYMGVSETAGKAFGPEVAIVTAGAERRVIDESRVPAKAARKGGKSRRPGPDDTVALAARTGELHLLGLGKNGRPLVLYRPVRDPGSDQPTEAIAFSLSSVWLMIHNPQLEWAEKLADENFLKHKQRVACFSFELRTELSDDPGPSHLFVICTSSEQVSNQMRTLRELLGQRSAARKNALAVERVERKRGAKPGLDHELAGEEGPLRGISGLELLGVCLWPKYGNAKRVTPAEGKYQVRDGPRIRVWPKDRKYKAEIQWTGAFQKWSGKMFTTNWDTIATARIYENAAEEEPSAIAVHFRGTENWNDAQLDLNLMEGAFVERATTFRQGRFSLKSTLLHDLLKLAVSKRTANGGWQYIDFFRDWYFKFFKPLLADFPNIPVYVCGVSLGGFLAQLLALHLNVSGHRGRVVCRTVAAPGAMRSYIDRGDDFVGRDVVPARLWKRRARGEVAFVNHIAMFDWVPKIGVQPGPVCLYADPKNRENCMNMASFNIKGLRNIVSCWNQHLFALARYEARTEALCCPPKLSRADDVCGFSYASKRFSGNETEPGLFSPYGWFNRRLEDDDPWAEGTLTMTNKRLGPWRSDFGTVMENELEPETDVVEEAPKGGLLVVLDASAARMWRQLTGMDPWARKKQAVQDKGGNGKPKWNVPTPEQDQEQDQAQEQVQQYRDERQMPTRDKSFEENRARLKEGKQGNSGLGRNPSESWGGQTPVGIAVPAPLIRRITSGITVKEAQRRLSTAGLPTQDGGGGTEGGGGDAGGEGGGEDVGETENADTQLPRRPSTDAPQERPQRPQRGQGGRSRADGRIGRRPLGGGNGRSASPGGRPGR